MTRHPISILITIFYSVFGFLFLIACKRNGREEKDTLPYKDRTGIQGRCTADWSCEDWMRTGHCNTPWSKFPQCSLNATGLIKDSCQKSCSRESCGRIGVTHSDLYYNSMIRRI